MWYKVALGTDGATEQIGLEFLVCFDAFETKSFKNNQRQTIFSESIPFGHTKLHDATQLSHVTCSGVTKMLH